MAEPEADSGDKPPASADDEEPRRPPKKILLPKLTEILIKHFKTPIFKYPDKQKMDRKLIEKHKELINDLHTLNSNLSFPPLMMTEALRNVGNFRKVHWQWETNDIEAFATTVGPRVRTVCRHVIQALRRKPRPAWNMTSCQRGQRGTGGHAARWGGDAHCHR